MGIARFSRGLVGLGVGQMVVVAGLAAAGCSFGPPAESDQEVTNTAATGGDFEAFRASLAQPEPGIYAVEDMLLDEERLHEHFALVHAEPNALVVKKNGQTRHLWNETNRRDLTWCVSKDFGSDHQRVVQAMEAATRGWQVEAGAGLVFRYVPEQDQTCKSSNTNVRISVTLDPFMNDAYGKSPVGPNVEAGRQYSDIRLSPKALSVWDLEINSFGSMDLKGVVAHELGHTLGFYHEQSRPESNCYDQTWSASHEALTMYDPISIMHYVWVQNTSCTPTTRLWLTRLDGEGARAAYPGGTTPDPACLDRSYGRGVGKMPTCAAGQVADAGLCYPGCPSGYTGVGPVCWENCPSGYHDDGALCRRDAHIISANNSSCPWYDKCGLTFSRGCSKCPAGYTNDGCTCRRDVHIFAKRTVGRGVGTVPSSCGTNQDFDAGLCYPKCTPGFKGAGPVCWETCN